MTKISIIIILLFIAFTCKSQDTLPKGFPIQKWTGRIEASYVQSDSASILAQRDTNWIPRYKGTQVIWFHAGVDTAIWTWIGRWIKGLNTSGGGGSGNSILTIPNIATLQATTASDQQIAIVQGFYNVNDGGGGIFYYKVSSAVSLVSGFVVQAGSGQWFRLPTKGSLFDVRWFGVLGDGVTDNHALLQSAVNYIGTSWKGATLFFPGVDINSGQSYIISSRVLLRSFVNLLGEGKNSKVKNISANTPFGNANCFGWGNMEVPSFQGLTQYSADSVYKNRIKLHTIGQASSFHVGDIITISSLTGFNGAGGFYRPYVGQVSTVDSIAAGSGLIIMDDLIDTTLVGANIGINGQYSGSSGAVDELGDSCKIIEYCNVSNMSFESGDAWFGRTSMYKCNFDNIWATGLNGWGGNCMSHCTFKYFNLRFWRRAQEMDLFSHDTRYENFSAQFVPGKANGDTVRIPQIRLGENCRNLYIHNYILNITGFYCANPVEFNESFSNIIDGLTVYGNLNSQGDVEFNNSAAQDSAFVENNRVINSSFFLDTTTNHYVKFGNNGLGHAVNQNNLVANCFFYHNLGGGKNSVDFDGTNNMVLGGFMQDTSSVLISEATAISCTISATLLNHTESDDGIISTYGISNDGRHNIISPQSVTIHGLNLQGGFNTAVGYGAMDTLLSGVNNTAIGYQSLSSVRSGMNNTAIGYQTSSNQDTAISGNTAVGYRAMRFVQNGTNTAVGAQALLNLTTGSGTALGYQALMNDTSGSRNLALGYQAGLNNGAGNDNLYIGRLSGSNNQDGSGNIFVGTNAGTNMVDGANNTFVGKSSMATHFNDSNTINLVSCLFGINTPNANTVDSTTTGAARWGFGVRMPTAFVHIQASTGTTASLRIQPGHDVNLGNRNSGDIWIDTAHDVLAASVNGIKYQLNKPIIFTPANSTDNTYPIGTMTVDDSFIWYRNSGGNWIKSPFASF